jgi:hypothetical protein
MIEASALGNAKDDMAAQTVTTAQQHAIVIMTGKN